MNYFCQFENIVYDLVKNGKLLIQKIHKTLTLWELDNNSLFLFEKLPCIFLFKGSVDKLCKTGNMVII